MTLLPVPFFEGCEKKIEIHFRTQAGDDQGIRRVGRAVWSAALKGAGITIESELNAPGWDCYMLSESSLFVSRDRLVCKTCGQSAPLAILKDALSHGEALGCPAQLVIFSRSNLLKPEMQRPVHRSFSNERDYLDGQLPVKGKAYTFGDVSGAHWNLYVANLHPIADGSFPKRVSPTLEVAMYDLDPVVMTPRWMSGMHAASDASTEVISISSALCPEPVVDDMIFDPCGYSMNAYGLEGTYCCVHVTPQDGCSFASFEASAEDPVAVAATVRALVNFFRPAKFSAALLELGSPTSQPPFEVFSTAGSTYAKQAACSQQLEIVNQKEHQQQIIVNQTADEKGAMSRFSFSSFEDRGRTQIASHEHMAIFDKRELQRSGKDYVPLGTVQQAAASGSSDPKARL